MIRSGSVTTPACATYSANCSAMYVQRVPVFLGEWSAVGRVQELDRAEEAPREHDRRDDEAVHTAEAREALGGGVVGAASATTSACLFRMASRRRASPSG